MCGGSKVLYCKFMIGSRKTRLMEQGWIFYAQSEFRDVTDKLQYLRSANELALTCLEYHVEDAMELVAEVLENYPKFFEARHLEMLWAAIAGPWGLEILQNSDAETVSLARIIVAYGQSLLDSKDLYKFANLSHNQQVLCKWNATFEMWLRTRDSACTDLSCSLPS